MKVALNLLYLTERSGGVGRYMTELTASLVRAGADVVALHSRDLPEDVRHAPWASAIAWQDLGLHVLDGPPWAFASTTWAQWVTTTDRAKRAGAQVLHGPAYIGPPMARGIRTVVTVPDLVYTRHPTLLDTRTRIGMQMTVGPSARGADRVIAISEAVRDDVVATLRVRPDRVDVTPLGARVDSQVEPTDEAVLRDRFALGRSSVILCVAQKRVHKNLVGLLRAIPHLRTREAVVVMVGLPTPHERELRVVAEGLSVAERVRQVGWVAEQDLEGLYALASCCCLPSFEEGFGLPVIEAMARGVPVACSTAGALGEVAGTAAEPFDPNDPTSIARALDRVLGDDVRAAELRAAGRDRAARFTWDRTAATTLGVYERALTAPGRRGTPMSRVRRRP
jgi:glycosyltransferase involved in cell wall biosynthesis